MISRNRVACQQEVSVWFRFAIAFPPAMLGSLDVAEVLCVAAKDTGLSLGGVQVIATRCTRCDGLCRLLRRRSSSSVPWVPSHWWTNLSLVPVTEAALSLGPVVADSAVCASLCILHVLYVPRGGQSSTAAMPGKGERGMVSWVVFAHALYDFVVASFPPTDKTWLTVRARRQNSITTMSARSKRQWEGGVRQGAAATDPFLPPFQADLWQRVVPSMVQAAVVEVDGWATAGGAVVVPAKAAQGQPGLIRQPGCRPRVAAHAGVGIAHISSATLQFGVATIHRGRVCTKDLYLDLLAVAEAYITAPLI